MSEPGNLVAAIEQSAQLPTGGDERFAGYGVMGLPFRSGHVLALRRFPASSIGQGYTSVWHRDPAGAWTFYQDVPPEMACPRYFGSSIAGTLVRDIDVRWTGPRSFSVTVSGDDGVSWDVSLASTAATRLMNAMSRAIPGPLWQRRRFLGLMGAMASAMLGAGKLGLTGVAPNGQTFIANPQLIWFIPESRATVRGDDLGPLGPVVEQAKLGDFWIPQRGLFAIGRAFFEPFDASKHRLVTAQA